MEARLAASGGGAPEGFKFVVVSSIGRQALSCGLVLVTRREGGVGTRWMHACMHIRSVHVVV